jgi:hypothetical protein
MKKIILSFLICGLMVSSCKKEQTASKINQDPTNFNVSAADQKLAIINKEVASILQEVYADPKAVFEVNAAIKSEYYEDERVLLRDLIFPEVSPLYKTDAFKQYGSPQGVVRTAFLTELEKGKYPVMKELLKHNLSSFQSPALREMTEDLYSDTAQEVFRNPSGVCVYFPYSENFPANLNPTNSGLNTSNATAVTMVAGDREADEAPAYRPYWYYVYGQNGEPYPQTIMIPVTVNDDYAEIYPTHIINSGATVHVMDPPPPPTPNQLVFIGEVMCTQQMDRLVSIHNGGGPDLRFVRGDGYLQVVGGQITDPGNFVPVKLKRKDVRKNRWKTVNMIWDSNWESDNKEQVFAIYEYDTEGDETINGSFQTTSTYPASGGNPSYTATGTQTYSYTLSTNNPIIRQMVWDRTSFFGYNHGNLNNGCGSRNGWTIYDCTGDVRYTMPQQ